MAKKKEESKTPKKLISEILPKRYRLKCKNKTQKELAKSITEGEIVVVSGPPGVGKSYVSVGRAIELIQNKTSTYNKIIIVTPAEGVGEDLGFIPGTLREKMEPYIASTMDIFDKIIGKPNRIELEKSGVIEIQPLGFIRGKSIDNTILLVEEGQNMSTLQMKTVLTRIGDNSKFVISGDLEQSDRYKNHKQSGLYDIMTRHRNVDEIKFIEFQPEDIVRNPLIIKILDNYKDKSGAQTTNPNKIIKTEPIMIKHGTNNKWFKNLKDWFSKNISW